MRLLVGSRGTHLLAGELERRLMVQRIPDSWDVCDIQAAFALRKQMRIRKTSSLRKKRSDAGQVRVTEWAFDLEVSHEKHVQLFAADESE